MNLKYFESEESLEKIFVDNKDVFEQIEDYGQQLLGGVLSTTDDYKALLNFMTGAYVKLEPLYSMAEAIKLNEELKKYAEIKRDLEGRGEKIVAANLEREASLGVASYRRVRALLEGYVLSCEKCIITAQTQLKRLEQDPKFKPQDQVQ